MWGKWIDPSNIKDFGAPLRSKRCLYMMIACRSGGWPYFWRFSVFFVSFIRVRASSLTTSPDIASVDRRERPQRATSLRAPAEPDRLGPLTGGPLGAFTRGRISTLISIFVRGSDPRRRAGALVLLLLLLAIGASGCGSSTTDVQGSAKEKKEEDRYRYEGTGKAKQKVLIRHREERFKELIKAEKNPG